MVKGASPNPVIRQALVRLRLEKPYYTVAKRERGKKKHAHVHTTNQFYLTNFFFFFGMEILHDKLGFRILAFSKKKKKKLRILVLGCKTFQIVIIQ